MIYEMHLADIPFRRIVSGSKIIELRLYDEKRAKLNPGDKIIFTNISNEKVAVEITALYRYRSFGDLFAEIPPEKCGFDAGVTIEAACYEMRFYYSAKEEMASGIIGIKIKVIDLEETLSEMC